jgi:SAM-dependent methyltransferase
MVTQMYSSGGYENPSLAEFYDYVTPYQTRQDVSFFVEMAQRSEGPVLELGCGTGRVLIPTARAGVEILGLDSAPQMLSRCRKKLLDEPQTVQSKVIDLTQADMRDFDLGRQFRLVTIPFRPFQHLLTVEDQLACLQTIRRHLFDSGVLIIDIFNPSLPYLVDDQYRTETEDAEFTLPDGSEVKRHGRVVSRNYFDQIIDSELVYYVSHSDGRQERLVHRFQMRYLFRYEIEHLLTRSGFTVENVYADYDKSPFGSKYPGELIVVARKSHQPESKSSE